MNLNGTQKLLPAILMPKRKISKEFPFNDYIEKLNVGENIIAIQALNKGKSSSDFLFSCNLLVKLVKRRDYSTDYPLIYPTNQNQLRSTILQSDK